MIGRRTFLQNIVTSLYACIGCLIGTKATKKVLDCIDSEPAEVISRRSGTKFIAEIPSEDAKMQKVSQDIYGTPDMLEHRNNMWHFYINGVEVESSRAIDEHGCLRMPFKGAKPGDICAAWSPVIKI